MAIKHFEKLSSNYLELLEREDNFDVIIKVGKSTEIKEFKAHSIILKFRSSYFKNKLENFIKDTDSIMKIDLRSHISIQQFEIIIKFIYGGIVSLDNLDSQLIFDLIFVAEELLLEELVESLEAYLIEFKSHWLRTHFTHIYKTSFQNTKLKELQKWCNCILVKQPSIIFESEEFTTLSENALVSLIKRDDLQMEEIIIWNYVIKWGIAQNPHLTSEPKYWSDENFKTLKITLKNCLTHIRYFQISGEDVANYIFPYNQILEKKIWEDLIKNLLLPNYEITSKILSPRIESKLPIRLTEPFSAVINEEHAAEIASWIDRSNITSNTINTSNIRNNPYEFKLLLRGSKDGFTRQSFWKLCKMKENTVTVINVKGNDNVERIFGGYSPVAWDDSKTGTYANCSDSFIFSLKNSSVRNSIISRVKNPAYSIYINNCFGINFGGGHLAMFVDYNEQTNGCYSHYYNGYYERQIGIGYYFINEYEVFQVCKKSKKI